MSDDVGEILIGFCLATGMIIIGLALIVGAWWGIAAGMSKYSVWSQGKEGEAQLAKANWNRNILVSEAKAKKEAAKLLAEAEVERAKGVAKANEIIGQSLNNNESYLRYLWINNLANEKNQVIYVPTEANLPILEASRFHKTQKGGAQ